MTTANTLTEELSIAEDDPAFIQIPLVVACDGGALRRVRDNTNHLKTASTRAPMIASLEPDCLTDITAGSATVVLVPENRVTRPLPRRSSDQPGDPQLSVNPRPRKWKRSQQIQGVDSYDRDSHTHAVLSHSADPYPPCQSHHSLPHRSHHSRSHQARHSSPPQSHHSSPCQSRRSSPRQFHLSPPYQSHLSPSRQSYRSLPHQSGRSLPHQSYDSPPSADQHHSSSPQQSYLRHQSGHGYESSSSHRSYHGPYKTSTQNKQPSSHRYYPRSHLHLSSTNVGINYDYPSKCTPRSLFL